MCQPLFWVLGLWQGTKQILKIRFLMEMVGLDSLNRVKLGGEVGERERAF